MLKAIVDFSVRQKAVAIALTVLAAFGGYRALQEIPINSIPDVTPVQTLVITKAGRYSPFDVERLVSYPIETAMNGLPNVKEVRSISQFGLSAVTVEFDEGTNIYFARQIVSQRIRSVADELPEGVSTPQLGPISTALGEIYQYVVKGDGYSLTELRTIQDWLIAPQLKIVRGVTEINSFGGFVKQYEIRVLPGKLRAYRLGLDDVLDAAAENNGVAGGNYLEHNREQYIVRGFGQITNARDIEQIIVKKYDDRPVYMRDVADVTVGKQLRQGAVTKDGDGEVVTGIVMMLRGGNGKDVIAAVEEKIAEVNKSLPEGVTIEKFYDQSDLVDRTTNTVTVNLVEGGFFVVVVLLLLLGEIRGAIIVALVIPLSMLFAFIGMYEFGLAANLMSLGAIDFGMVVDGSVVMVENVVHRLQRAGKGADREAVIREAAAEVARPIFFGVLIILMVYIPIATFSGMEGILFRPMAITVASAVFGSLLLALTFVPAMTAIAYRKGVKVRKNYVIDWLKPRYERFLRKRIEKRGLIFGAAGGLLVATVAIVPYLGTEFLPELDEGSILVELIRMPSVTLDESVEKADKLAAKIMKNIPEVKTVVPKTGRSDLANDWMGVHQTDVWVVLKPTDEWRDGVAKKDIEDMIEPFVADEPGLAYNFTQPIAMRVDELTSGVKSDVAVKIYGEDLDTLAAVGSRIGKIVAKLDGTDNYFVERPFGQPYYNIAVDRDAIAFYGLNISDVQRVVETGIGGSGAGEVFEGQRRFEIVVRFPEEFRGDFESVRNIPVPLPSGGFVPLKSVAKIGSTEGPREIQRENGWRRVVVGANIEHIDIGTFTANLREAIEGNANVPAGYFVEYSGAFEDQQRAMNHLYVVVPLALFIIVGLLYLMFGNLKDSGVILLNLPFALTGGVFMLFARGLYLSVSASIGFVALFGVATLNGIVLVAHLNETRKHATDDREAIVQGASDRLRPVLMTALVASLGFIPMAFNTGPGSEVQRPLASVVVGGLVTATLATLFLLPAVYRLIGAGKEDATSENNGEEKPNE
ncbi:MAG: CusA/CzcA family heavy metal efflux RND transporter [Ignavibacteriales bacterium]|nr:CusA/CzcA family heavy metal efflux RND transporter [Ignavibacteriales bacterium]